MLIFTNHLFQFHAGLKNVCKMSALVIVGKLSLSSLSPLSSVCRDEDAPAQIPDEGAVKPDGWLDDEPEYVSDPDAIKPEDWYGH